MRAGKQDLSRGLHTIAYRQAGYFSAAQALAIGYSYQAQKHHVDAGNWLRIDRGVFRLPAWPAGPDDSYVRWTLWSRGICVVSHATALAVHDLSDADPARIHLTVPAGFRGKTEGAVLHHADLPDAEVEQRAGWRVTAPVRTLLDIAASDISQEIVDGAVTEARERGLVTARRLRSLADSAGDRAALRIERALGARA